jgi:Flp pilus assembly protein TadG
MMIDRKRPLMCAIRRRPPALLAHWIARWIGSRLTCNDRGAGAVELALVAPLLVGLLLGTVHYGSVAVHRMQMANAVRAGLQYASVRKPVLGEDTDLSPITDAVKTAAPAAGKSDRSVVSSLYCECSDGTPISCQDTCATGNRSVFVRIVITESFSPLVGLADAKTTPLRATGTIRIN